MYNLNCFHPQLIKIITYHSLKWNHICTLNLSQYAVLRPINLNNKQLNMSLGLDTTY